MKKMVCFSFTLMVAALVWSACGGKDSTTSTTHKVTCNGQNITYSNYVRGLIKTSCIFSGCHDGATYGAGDYREISAGTIAAGLKAKLDDGSFETAVLVKNRMPLGGSLPDSILVRLECWFKAGYPN